MTAGKYDLTIEQGATLDRTITWYDGPGQTNLHNLITATARMQVRDVHENLLLELTTANGRIVLGGALGTIQLLVDAATTAALTPTNRARYDLEIVDGATVVRLIKGRAIIDEEETK